MPQLSDSMEEGIVLSWLAEPGTWVEVGDELVEIETDKATMTQPAEASGVLEVIVNEGDRVAVGELIARMRPAGGEVDRETEEPATAPPAVASEPDGDQSTPPAATTMPDEVARPVSEPRPKSEALATPLARRIAAAHEIALETITGSGPRGRVTKRDVAAAIGIESPVEPAENASAAKAATSGRPTAGVKGAKGQETVIELSHLQQVIARRMAESKATVPHLQVQTDVSMDAAAALRSSFKEFADEEAPPSINDLVVKASAMALREHPKANGSYRDDTFVLYERINVGIAVTTDDGLVVPTVTDTDKRTLGEIARETRRLAARVRSGEITPPELSGGTFTVSNLGMFGMNAIYPVINGPQAAILGVGAAREILRRDRDGEIVSGLAATLTLSCDHRILYGADAALLLTSIREKLEAPLRMVL